VEVFFLNNKRRRALHLGLKLHDQVPGAQSVTSLMTPSSSPHPWSERVLYVPPFADT
jgi:hypothetical protein